MSLKRDNMKYLCWKCSPNGYPIEGTDRIISAKSKRAAIKEIAYAEGIVIEHGALLARCDTGEFWACAVKERTIPVGFVVK
jgi:hypothetical protein